jgi:alpha-galactosidase
MINFNSETKTFSLNGRSSQYTMQVNHEDRLLHVAWGPKPVGGETAVLTGNNRLVPLGFTSFEFQGSRDELLAYGDISIHEVALKVSFPDLPEEMVDADAPHTPIRDVRLRYHSHEIVTDAQPGLASQHGLPVRNSEPRETLCIHMQDPVQPLRVTLCYRLTPEHDIIERWLMLQNIGESPILIEQCYFASLHLPPGTSEVTTTHGAWAAEFTQQQQTLPVGNFSIGHRSVQTGHVFNPFFLANRPGQAWEESGIVYFGALAYSGAWQIVFNHQHSGDVRVFGGYNPFDFELILDPGESHTTPAFVCGVSDNGWGGASRRLHRFTRERVLPETPIRPVLYNSWEATYFSLSYEGQLALARKAAAMGVELFVVDDGWFGGRRTDFSGLGDWWVSPDVFPDGLQPLIDEVHKLGMQFGLWFEPEMVNPDSDLYRQHPDWVLHFPGRPRTEARFQLVLDFGRKEVVDYIFTAMDTMLSQYDIDFIKWDMNRSVSEPGSVAGKAIWRAHVAGVYALMDRLRQTYPKLSIQSCSGGGGRIDLGIMARTDQVWTSDNTDALDRIRIQEGFSLAYPARAMETWVTHEKNHQTGRVLELSTRFDVAMRGALGIGSNLNELDDAELKDYARYIRFYKKIRRVVQEGDVYRLARLEEEGATAVLYVLPDASEAVYSVAVKDHIIGHFRSTALLHGLNADAVYAITDLDDYEVARLTGFELMVQGIPGDSLGTTGYSRTLHLKEVTEE